MRVAVVPVARAEEIRLRLRRRGRVDARHRITRRGDEILIPLNDAEDKDLEKDPGLRFEDVDVFPERPRPPSPVAEIRGRLRTSGVPSKLSPSSWRRIGEVVVVRLSKSARRYATEIGQVVGEVLGAKTVIEDRSGIHGAWRRPDVRVLWGDETETVHLEGGVRYKLDAATIMFSAGNTSERVGLPDRIRPDSVVVDLFAGIGYFSLPIAVRHPSSVVYACEVNPESYRFLVENLRLNRITNVIPLLGDCRATAPQRVADWVLMGHFDARDHLDVAFRALRDRGTILYHELSPKEQYPLGGIERVAEAATTSWYRVLATRTRIVKSYAPGIVHVAIEADVAREMRA